MRKHVSGHISQIQRGIKESTLALDQQPEPTRRLSHSKKRTKSFETSSKPIIDIQKLSTLIKCNEKECLTEREDRLSTNYKKQI